MAVIALTPNDYIKIFGDGSMATYPFTFNQFNPPVTVNITFKAVNRRVIVKIPIIQGINISATPQLTSTTLMSTTDYGLYAPVTKSSTLIRTISGNTRMLGLVSIGAVAPSSIKLTISFSMFDASVFTTGSNSGNSTQGFVVY